MNHTIFDAEIDGVMAAADILFSPQPDGKSDPRTAFQEIHHILENVKRRSW
jgi:hypothetical protein